MEMPGRRYVNGSGYRYGFNGKENDNEVKGEGNELDYGMRVYDTRVAKFLSIDPLQTKYPELTPYQFASNSPIANVDLDGLEKKFFVYEWKEQTGLTFLKVFTQKNELGTFADCFRDIGRAAFGGSPLEEYEDLEKAGGPEIKELTYVPVVLYPGGYTYQFPSFKAAMNADHEKVLDALKANEMAKAIGYAAQTVNSGQDESFDESLKADISFSRASSASTETPVSVQNSQVNRANGGNSGAADANTAGEPVEPLPTEAYNRSKHYGKTPTAGDRKALGAQQGEDVDHTVPLVKHYYEGDGNGGAPGFTMTKAQRQAFARNKANMSVKPKSTNRSEGAQLSQYSKEKKKQYNLGGAKKSK